MAFEKKTYKEIASDILTQICGGTCIEKPIYNDGKNLYKLSNLPVTEVKSVEGTLNGENRLFVKNTDFDLAVDSIEWLAKGVHPDNNTVFSVDYLFTRPYGISDVNVGSVVRTLVEAVSRELEYFYLQMEQAYLSGFLETATGNALDLVVSLIGIKRKPPLPSSGAVTFGRSTEPEALAVVGEVHLWDGSKEYALNKPLAKDITKIQGTLKSAPAEFVKDIDYVLSGDKVKWLSDGNNPDAGTVFQVDYSAYREIIVSKGTTVATRSLKAEETRLFRTLESAALKVNPDGKWMIEVPIVSLTPGDRGNVLAGTIIVMPSAVPGVEFAINKADITNGVKAETDKELRERAKHALEFAGKATYFSIESAIRSVEGVKSLLIEDMPDGIPGIVKVVVDGGNIDEIKRVIDDTRAAGIKIEVSRPQIVYINISLILTLHKEAQPAQVMAETEKRVRSYVSTLGIGESVLFSRLIEWIVGIEDVWDVQDIEIAAMRQDGSVVESEKDNIDISNDERAEPKTINISYEKRK